jgi:hypothetical protein
VSDLATRFHQHVKANSKCMVCGSFEHITFHHIKPADKFSEVCKIARTGDLTATVNELNKTIPICEMDHTRIHRGRLSGWLDGQFDNGGVSTGQFAYQYSPYLNWLAKKRPQVFKDFYERYIEPNNKSLAPLFNAAGVCLFPQAANMPHVHGTIDRAQIQALGSLGIVRGLNQ